MSIPARYPGTCAECGQRIEVGERIDWRPRTIVHADGRCPEPAELVVDRPPCPRCFTVPSVAGACLCEEP